MGNSSILKMGGGKGGTSGNKERWIKRGKAHSWYLIHYWLMDKQKEGYKRFWFSSYGVCKSDWFVFSNLGRQVSNKLRCSHQTDTASTFRTQNTDNVCSRPRGETSQLFPICPEKKKLLWRWRLNLPLNLNPEVMWHLGDKTKLLKNSDGNSDQEKWTCGDKKRQINVYQRGGRCERYDKYIAAGLSGAAAWTMEERVIER